MIEFLEVSLASYFYFCPFTPGAFSMPRGKRRSLFFLCVSLILSGGRPRRKRRRTRSKQHGRRQLEWKLQPPPLAQAEPKEGEETPVYPVAKPAWPVVPQVVP